MPKTTPSFDAAEYAPVAERVALFWARHPTGRIVTELVARTERAVTFRALLYREAGDAHPAATGWASEREGDGEVNAVACLENAETSAVGRALANLGFAASRPGARGQPRPAARAAHVRVVREPLPRPADEALQQRADVARDVLALLAGAERAGLRAARVERIRTRVLGDRYAPSELARVERTLRDWLLRHADRPGAPGDGSGDGPA